jgi:hypothetical protein
MLPQLLTKTARTDLAIESPTSVAAIPTFGNTCIGSLAVGTMTREAQAISSCWATPTTARTRGLQGCTQPHQFNLHCTQLHGKRSNRKLHNP